MKSIFATGESKPRQREQRELRLEELDAATGGKDASHPPKPSNQTYLVVKLDTVLVTG